MRLRLKTGGRARREARGRWPTSRKPTGLAERLRRNRARSDHRRHDPLVEETGIEPRREQDLGPYDRLRVGDELTIWHHGHITCRAKVIGRKDARLAVVVWNSVAERWNNHTVLVGPRRIAKYPRRLGGVTEGQ
jgi:hypothetical protein